MSQNLIKILQREPVGDDFVSSRYLSGGGGANCECQKFYPQRYLPCFSHVVDMHFTFPLQSIGLALTLIVVFFLSSLSPGLAFISPVISSHKPNSRTTQISTFFDVPRKIFQRLHSTTASTTTTPPTTTDVLSDYVADHGGNRVIRSVLIVSVCLLPCCLL